MDENKTSNPSPEKPTDKDYKKKRVEEIGSTLAQIKARVKANRSCARKEDESKTSTREILSEKSEKYIQVLELDKAKAQKLEKERPKIKEAIENLKIDRENQKLVEKKIEETRAKQSAPLPEIPSEVQKRISDLEITIHNLKETLSEKERILESKTESWKLLSDQLEQRNIEVVERYEIMSREIDEVKKSYAEQEVFLRNELEKCKSKLQDADSQLISQENWRRDEEESRLELESLKQTHSECENKYGELQRSFEAEKKLCLKLKAQIRNYRNQINSKKDLSSEVERLQNQIATLEEEKEAAIKSEGKANELETTLKNVEAALFSSKELSDQLSNDYQDVCIKLNEKEEVIKKLTESLEKMEQSKISSEFKAVELEEKLEMENKEDKAQNDKMCKDIDNLKQHVKQQEKMVEELRTIICQKEDEIAALRDNKDMEYSFAYDTQDLKDLLEEWKLKYNRIEESVRSVEDEKMTMSAKILSLQEELGSVSERYEKLVSEAIEKESVVDSYIKNNNELVELLAKSSEKIALLETEIAHCKKPEPKHDDQTQKLKKLAANLKIKVKLCKDLEEKLIQQEKALTTLTNEKTELENIVSEYKLKLENISLDTEVVQQLKNLLSEKENIIQQLSDQDGQRIQAIESAAFQRARKESQSELVERDSAIKHLKEENLLLESKLNENMIEIHSVDESEQKSSETGAPKHSIELEKHILLEQVDSSLIQIKSITQELETKNKIIQELEKNVLELNNKLEIANSLHMETKNKLDLESKLVEDFRVKLQQFEMSQDRLNSDISSHSSLQEQIKSLQAELENCHKIISSKENIITTFEKEMSSLKTEINQNESQLVKIQELYVEESSRNDGVITNIESLETELNLSKNEIVSLSEQLGNVSLNYDQCLEQLKEKDIYIDKLEKDLNTMREKLKKLEKSINERHKAMEDQARKLGEKLNEASSMGVNFEQYRSEMEQKLAKFDETEKHLNARIKELVNVNGELELDKKIADERVNELEAELTDIKSAYNTTLDQIELLNGELTEVMAQIEHRNRELIKIGEERNSLINRLSELEGTCNDLKARLQLYEEQSETLKSELDNKLKELDLATNEITHLQSQLENNQITDSTELNKELEVLKTEYEERLRELQIEKDDLLKVIKGSVEPEVDSLMKAAEDKAENIGEIKLFSWGGHTESAPPDEVHDDSWGWSASEAKLEEEYQNSEANKLRQLEGEKNALTADNKRLEEEVKSLKIKCTKLVAKVKELKTSEKNKTKTGFEDLDFAMQEELRSQVDDISKKNKELLNEISIMKMEKERLMKRIETLTSANNQLIEMKERQDIEVQVWQRNCTELKNQLHSFDWNESANREDVKPPLKEIGPKSNSELEDKLAFLETENEELLQIICSLKDEKQASNNLLTEIDNLKLENESLKQIEEVANNQNIELISLKQTLKEKQIEVQTNLSEIDQLVNDKKILESRLESLKLEMETEKKTAQSHFKELSKQEVTSEQIKSDLESFERDCEVKNKEIASLKEALSNIEELNSQLNNELFQLKADEREKDSELSRLQENLSQLNSAVKQIEDLQSEQLQLTNEIDNLKSVVQSLSEDNENLRSSYSTKLAEIDLLKADMKMVEASKEAAMSDLEILRDEFNRYKSKVIPDKSEVPFASSMFSNDPESHVFTMSTSAGVSHSSVPCDIPKTNLTVNQISHSIVGESPPVFRGFFSDQNDPFLLIQQPFEVEPDQTVQLSQKEEDSSASAFPQIETVESDHLSTLKQKVLQLEEENFNLIQKINESQLNKNEGNNLIERLSKKDCEIIELHKQIEELNDQNTKNRADFENEKGELLRSNTEFSLKITELLKTIDLCHQEINSLNMELGSLRNNQDNESEKLKFDEEIRKQEATESERVRHSDRLSFKEHMEEQLRESERNFQNSLLNKEEENAHLVCEVSAKQALCDRLTTEIESLKSKLSQLEDEIKSSHKLYEARAGEISLLKQDLDRLQFENNELRKVKENDVQIYAAQIDYLQQSVQEKDVSIDSLNTKCNQLSEQIITLQEELRVSLERSSYLENCYSSLSSAHNQQSADFSAVHDRLRVADEEIKRLNISLTSLTQEVNEDRARLEQEKFCNESLRNKEADQVRLLTSEIEVLQSTITEKDFEIERLSQLLTGLQEKLIKAEESKISDEVLVLRNKLDKALYTVHLRDTKCDELTVEIMHLLGERDSLQLRLSEALRAIEELRKAKPDKSVSELVPSLPESKSTHDLNNKMGELQTGYMKDPAVRVDRENRHSEQMHLFTSADSGPPIEAVKKQEPANSDFGILNWFFSSSTSPQPSQEPGT